MKVDVKALIESIGYIQSAIPYFIESQSLKAYDGLVMFDQVETLQNKLETFDDEFQSALDFHNNLELKTYLAELRSRTDESIRNDFKDQTIPKTKAIEYVLENFYDAVKEAVFEQEAEAQKA